MKIDVAFDFTTDTPGFWDGFWENKDGLGAGSADPDARSPMLRRYHRLLWSRKLPNGEEMTLQEGSGYASLSWGDRRFGSDSILVSFRYTRYREMIAQVEQTVSDYHAFVEDYLRKMYTIGGMIIFPQRQNGINQSRGRNEMICDRWDLTMECIRRHYRGEDSPLTGVLKEDAWFFDLFVDFRGYVDFFFLQDCVSEDYESVVFWEGDGTFRRRPFPETVSDYLLWIERELDFLEKRNQRIDEWQKQFS